MIRTPRWLVGVMLGIGLVGCSDGGSSESTQQPDGPASLALVTPQDQSCNSVDPLVAGRLPWLVSVTNLDLKPPGVCGEQLQCGHIEVYAEGLRNGESATLAGHVELFQLADPYHDGQPHADTGEPDFLDLEFRVVDDEGQAILDAEEQPLTASLELVTVPDCSAL